jgi:hypothetical protein
MVVERMVRFWKLREAQREYLRCNIPSRLATWQWNVGVAKRDDEINYE